MDRVQYTQEIPVLRVSGWAAGQCWPVVTMVLMTAVTLAILSGHRVTWSHTASRGNTDCHIEVFSQWAD